AGRRRRAGPRKQALSATLAHPIALAGVDRMEPPGLDRSGAASSASPAAWASSPRVSEFMFGGDELLPLLQRDPLRPCVFPLPTCELHHVHSARQFYYRAPVPVSSSDTNQPQLAAISKEEHQKWEN